MAIKRPTAIRRIRQLLFVASVAAFAVAPTMPARLHAEKAEPPAENAKRQSSRTDLYGDRLPPGALARMGTIRFAQGDSIDGYPVLAPDHKTFATVSRQTPYGQGRTICLWDADTGEELRHFEDPNFEHYRVFFLKREKLLGTLGWSRKPVPGELAPHAMQLWVPTTGKKVAGSFQVLGDLMEPWALSVDERLLVSASIGPPVAVRDRRTGKILAKCMGDGTRICSLAFSPDGKIVAIGTGGAILLWDWQAKREASQLSNAPRPNISGILGLWFSPDGRWFAAALGGEGLRIWDTKRWAEALRLAEETNIRFFPDGKKIISVNTGKIWDIARGKQIGRLENYADCVALDISADGRSVTGYAMGRIRRWDAVTGKDRSLPAPSPRRIMIHQVGFLPDGKTVVSASPDGSIRIWDAASGKELRTVVKGTVWEPQTSKPIFVRVAADGTIVVAQGKRLSFFKGESKAEEIELEAETASLNLSPDGKTFVLAASNRLAQIWDVAGRKIVGSSTLPERTSLEALGISSDGTRIAAYVDRAVVLLNASGVVEKILEKRPERPRIRGAEVELGEGYSYFPGTQAFAFSPTGDVLASSGHLGALKILDAHSGRTRHTLTPPPEQYHHPHLRNIVFSPNGRMIASESSDGVVDVWETSTGQLRHRFLGHRSYQTTLAFSPDGLRLATGNRDATILIWDVFGLWTGKAADFAPLAEKELPVLWERLREKDAEQACRILGRLMRSPEISAAFLKRRLLSRKGMGSARLRAWIAELDDADFHKRETASRELAKHLPTAEPLLKECLTNKPSLEMRRRIENLMCLMESQSLSAETIRDLRALEVLERFGLAAIEDIARELAEGNYDPHIVVAAKEARQRLKMRVP